MRIPDFFLRKCRESLFREADRGFRHSLDNLCTSLFSYKILFAFIPGLCFLYADDLCGISVYHALYFIAINHKKESKCLFSLWFQSQGLLCLHSKFIFFI